MHKQSLNSVLLVGKVDTAPIIVEGYKNVPLTSFSLVTSRITNDAIGKAIVVEESHNIVAFSIRPLEEILTKGSLALVKGALSYEMDNKTGSKTLRAMVFTEKVQILGSDGSFKDNSINEATMVGRLMDDPFLKKIDMNKYAVFNIKTRNIWIDENSKDHENFEFHHIVARNDKAIYSEYLRRGDWVIVQGPILYKSLFEGDEQINTSQVSILANLVIPLNRDIYIGKYEEFYLDMYDDIKEIIQ